MTDWDRKPGFDLSGKRALVVGAGSPAAQAIALGFAEAGADVAVASATLDGDEIMDAKRLSKAIGAMGRATMSQGWDVTLPTNIQVGLRQVVKDFGRPSIIVYAADATSAGPVTKVTDTEFARLLNVNTAGAFSTSRSFFKEHEEGVNGRLIFVTSLLGERGMPNLVAYAAAKAGIAGLVAALAQEGGPLGITANAIATGWMEWTPGRGPAEIGQNRLLRYIPLKRFGTGDDVAGLALLLASDAASFLNGQVFHVDGGVAGHL
ncbi:MAG: SDR family oxidoreductase [Dehalococcoidia bacterium]|nr:SDR family oxidoreductase [Dehalococcoidia bacterium]